MPTKKPSVKQLAARAKFIKMVRAKAAKSKAAKSKGVKKKLGALPIGFSGSVWGVNFKVINQYSIYNDVSAIVEDKKNGNTIVVFDGVGNSKDKADTMVSYFAKNTNTTFDDSDKKALKGRMLKFAANMQMEVKNFNAGKKKTIKKSPLVILKPIAPKKAATKKTIKKKVYKQTGGSNLLYDKRLQALRPGKRISKKGNKYTENRENRSDKGRLLGIGNVTMDKLHKVNKDIINMELALDKNIKTSKLFQYKTPFWKKELAKNKKNIKKFIIELKTHARELKKLL